MANNAGSLARKLTNGLYGKMEFDFACERSHFFGELYLHGAIMEIIGSNVDPSALSVRPSYAIDAIQKCVGKTDGTTCRRRGRPRHVDFAVVEKVSATEAGSLHYCLEVKWAGSSHATPVNVLKDLIRLALVSEANKEAECLFVLAGKRADVEKLVTNDLPDISKRAGKTPLTLTYRSSPRTYNMRNAGAIEGWLDLKHLRDLSKTFTKVPDQIETYMYKPRHETPAKWIVHAWRVRGAPRHSGRRYRSPKPSNL